MGGLSSYLNGIMKPSISTLGLKATAPYNIYGQNYKNVNYFLYDTKNNTTYSSSGSFSDMIPELDGSVLIPSIYCADGSIGFKSLWALGYASNGIQYPIISLTIPNCASEANTMCPMGVQFSMNSINGEGPTGANIRLMYA